MSQRDAFGRSADEPDPRVAQPFGARPEPSAERPPETARPVGGPPGAGRRRAVGAASVLATFVLLALGGVAIAGTLGYALDASRKDERVAVHALQHDPLGPKSMLRTTTLRRALSRLRAAAEPDDRLEGVVAFPDYVMLTLVDPRDQERWLQLDATGNLQTSPLSTTASGATVPLSLLKTLDPAPATRYLARRYAQLQPYARDPTLSLVLSTATTSSVTTGTDAAIAAATKAGILPPSHGETTRTTTQWSVSFHGVRQADADALIDAKGRPVR
jgi:hypothetical protein